MLDLRSIDLANLLVLVVGIIMLDRRITRLEGATKRIFAHLFPGEDSNIGP